MPRERVTLLKLRGPFNVRQLVMVHGSHRRRASPNVIPVVRVPGVGRVWAPPVVLGWERAPNGRDLSVGAIAVVDGLADLAEVVLALSASGGLTYLLDSGEKQPDQNRNDRNYH